MNSPEQTVRMLKGSCLCGVVTYEVSDEFRYAANCHCSQCRRQTGSAFKPVAGIAREKLRLTEGRDSLTIYGDHNGDGKSGDTHCRSCGSLLYSIVRDGTMVHVTMGTLVDAPSIRPDKHIFVGSKASWYDITDGLPQYEGHFTK